MADPPAIDPLRFDTLLHVEDLGGGAAIVVPLADPALASVGERDEALLEQAIGLPVALATANASVLARYSFPQGTRLFRHEVLVPRDDLPRSLAVHGKISVRAVVVPVAPLTVTRPRPDEARVRFEAWLFLLPFAYTCHVAIDERFSDHPKADAEAAARVDAALGARITDETLRLAAARELDPLAYLGLLPPPGGDRLEKLELRLARDGKAEGRAASLRRSLETQQRRRRAVEVLEAVAEPLHVQLRHGGRPPLLARDALLTQLGTLLSPRDEGQRGSVLLVGAGGVGKSALVAALVVGELEAQRSPVVYATSGAALIAGMSGLGQWQERVRRVMEAAAELDAVLWLDDVSDLFTERGRSHVDVPSAMRPFLEQGRVRVVAEVDEAKVARIERRNVGFFSCFSRLTVPPLSSPQVLAALTARAAFQRQRSPRAAHLAPAALPLLVELCERYLSYESEPGRSVRLYEEVRAAHDAGELAREVDAAAMLEAVSLRLGMPAFLLREDQALRHAEVVRALGARVLGQADAVRRVADVVCVVKAGLQPRGRPLASFLFVGPTGVGKTELARALADFLFSAGRDRGGERLVRFDMSEYMDALAAERLIAGDERGEGQLTRRVRAQPFCVVLLDEIEKAHPRVFDLLLQVLGEGRLTDAAGRTAHFHNTLIVMTSNLGTLEAREKAGFDRAADEDASHYQRVVEATFRPELVNRIDRVVPFGALGPDHRRTLSALALERVRRRRGLAEHSASLTVTDAALSRLSDEGHSAAFGARALRRHIEQQVVSRVAAIAAARGTLENLDVAISLADEPVVGALAEEVEHGLRVALVRRHGEAKAAREGAHALSALSAIRRTCVSLSRLDRVTELREQVRFLVAQLGRPAEARDGATISRLSTEHHRLAAVLGAVEAGRAELEEAEELALTAFFGGDAVEPLLDRCRVVEAEHRRAMLSALIALEPRRDEVTLLVQELDARRGLVGWLSGLVGWLRARKLEVEVHGDWDEDRRGHADWPKDRRWGPPRDLTWLLAGAAEPERNALSAVLRVRGKDAILLALEGGLHRDDRPSDGGEACFFEVRRVALRSNLLSREWAKLEPHAPATFGERVRGVISRRYRDRDVLLIDGLTAAVPKEVYFERLDEVHLTLLAAAEQGRLARDTLFAGSLADEHDEVRALLREEGMISAIKRYRELTGASLVQAKAAVEAMRDDEP